MFITKELQAIFQNTLSLPIDGSAGNFIFNLCYMEALDHTIFIVSCSISNLPPYAERKIHLNSLLLCRRPESTLCRLRSKRVCFPSLHCLSANENENYSRMTILKTNHLFSLEFRVFFLAEVGVDKNLSFFF